MENPAKEITSVVQQLTAAESPDVQKAAFEKYMAPDVSFHHPVCAVESGPNSREELLGIYQYMVFSPLTIIHKADWTWKGGTAFYLQKLT